MTRRFSCRPLVAVLAMATGGATNLRAGDQLGGAYRIMLKQSQLRRIPGSVDNSGRFVLKQYWKGRISDKLFKTVG